MNPAAARRIVAGIIRRLPEDLRKAAEEVPVCIEDYPDDDLTADGLAPDILGLFVGSPRHQHDHDPGPPPQILLFLGNILEEADEVGTTFEEEVGRTYLHELGHYLGLDEDALAERDLD
ncbi:MAG: metallopeptidase family protein [Chthoniobacterales bacterium]|nr:metallopeptidase family protein [Chthoniobacterales bacterium]